MVTSTNLERAIEWIDAEERAEVAAPAVAELWQTLNDNENTGFVGQAALIYRLMMTKVHPVGDPVTTVPLWQETLLRSVDEQDFPLIIPESWKEYCEQQLTMSPPQASSLKRIWEVYVIGMDRDLGELLEVGKAKLAAAVGFAGKMLPGRSEELESALFGDPERCWLCGWQVPGVAINPPGGCPNCEESWTSTPPLPYSRLVRGVLPDLKAKELGEAPIVLEGQLQVEFESDASVAVLRQLGWWVEGERETPLPALLIDIIDEDDVGLVVGLTIKQADEYRRYMERKFPRA